MRVKRLLEQTFGSLLTVLLLAGCGGGLPGPAAMDTLVPPMSTFEPTNIPTALPIPDTPTNGPTATLMATLPVTPPSSSLAEMPTGPGVEWHVAVVSESSGWGLGKAYANQIENDVGVQVTLDDFAIGDLSADDVLKVLQTGTSSIPKLEQLPAALREADVVVLFPSPMGSIHDDTYLNIRRCFGNVMGRPDPCPSDGFDEYTAELEAIWAKIFGLRSGKPTILRAMDDASPFVSRWITDQTFSACTVCWENSSAAAQRAAEAFHIPFLSRYAVYNGADHELDPQQQGYIGRDGIHPNALAQQYTAELLSKLGYEPVIPP